MTRPEQAYRALSHAAERIGANNWKALVASHRGKRRPRYHPTPAHRDVVDAMLAVMNGGMSPDEAMALLWRSDVWSERFAA